MANPSFTLYCEYIHCCGKKLLTLGKADTQEAASLWAKENNRAQNRPTLPPDDLIRTCPVRHCPAKLQIPRYSFSRGPVQ